MPGDSSARFLSVASKVGATLQGPKATRTCLVAQQARGVAPGEGKLGNKATVWQESVWTPPKAAEL